MKSKLPTTREEKIKLLKAIHRGEEVDNLLPIPEVKFIEDSPGSFFVFNELEDKMDCCTDVEAYLNELKQKQPGIAFRSGVMNHEEFIIAEAKLEAEY